MMKIGRRFEIDSSHFLPGHDKCGKVHGHTWTIDVELTGTQDRESEMIIDFHELKEIVKRVIQPLDHTLINDIEPFDKTRPTAENLSREFARAIYWNLNTTKHRLRISNVIIRVQEGKGGWAICQYPE